MIFFFFGDIQIIKGGKNAASNYFNLGGGKTDIICLENYLNHLLEASFLKNTWG